MATNPTSVDPTTGAVTFNTGPDGFGQTGVLGASTSTPSQTNLTVDPTIGQYYDSLQSNVQNQIGRLDPQAQIGSRNILDSYNSAYNKLLGQRSLADRNYQNAKDQTLQDNVTARGNIQQGVGQTANSLQRLLGIHGAGSSSAALFAAPFAAARTGAQQSQQVQQAFGRNQQALDTNYGDYSNQYNNSLTDLAHQRDTQQNGLQAGIDQNKASLLAQLANISQQRASAQPGASYADIVAAAQPYQNQINTLGTQIDQLGQQYANPVLQAAPATYQAPSLESYNYSNPSAAQVNTNRPGATSAVDPFLSVLLGGQDRNKQLAVQ